MDCFKNIIGISNTDNVCFTDEFSSDAKLSTSGKYMDQLEEFPSFEAFKSLAKADQVTLEKLLTNARENGIQNFKEELYMQLGLRYSTKAAAYMGTVGQLSGNAFLDMNFAFAGVTLDMARYRGATVKVTGAKPFFNTDGTLDVTVYRAHNTGLKYLILEQVGAFTINTLINNPAMQDITPLVLDTTDEIGSAYSYLFIFSTANGLQPRDNSTSCGCGNKELILHEYFYPKGIRGNDVNEMLITNRTDKINGLLLQVEARCTGGNFICDNYYSNEYIKEAINWAILRKSVSNAIVGIITSDLISRYTMAKREQLSMSVNILNSKFKKSVCWIAENMSLSNNDCFYCNPGGNGGSYNISTQGIPM